MSGLIARTVADAAIMFDAIAGFDPQDPTSLNEPPSNVLGQIEQGIKNVRIGLDRTYALKGIDSGQAAALENAIKVLESLGAQIVEVKMPNVADAVDDLDADLRFRDGSGTRGQLPISCE